MPRVEIPAPADVVTDTQGNVLSGRSVTLKLAGTATDVTHYSELTGGSSTTGGLVTHTDGTVRDGSGNRRYIDSGQSVDITVAGVTRQVEPISASVETSVDEVLEDRTPLDAKLDGGAVGSGVVNDGAAIKQTINTAKGALSVKREAVLPPGTYLIDDESILPDTAGITVRAPSRGSTVLKCAPGFTGFIMRASEVVSGTHGVMGPTVFEDIIFDGDSLNSTVPEATSGNPLVHAYNVAGAKFYRCIFQNGRSYGVGFQGYPEQANSTARGPIEDILFEACEFRYNGFRLTGDTTTLAEDLDDSETTITLTDASAFASSGTILLPSGEKVSYTGKSTNDLTGCTRGAFATTSAVASNGATVKEVARYDDGLDCKSSQRMTLIGCNFYGNADDGCDIRAHYLSMTGCYAWENGNGGIVVSVAQPANWLPEADGFAELNGCFGWDNLVNGIRLEVPAASRIGRVTLDGCGARGNGLDNLDANGSGGGDLHVTVNGGHYCNSVGGSGIRLNACKEATVQGAHCNDNAASSSTYGIQVANMPNGAGMVANTCTGNGRGIRLTGTTDKCRIALNKLTGNTTAQLTTIGTGNFIDDNNDLGVARSQTLATNANFTLTPLTSPKQTIHTGTLTVDRTITLSTTNAQVGMTFGIARSGAGAFNLSLGGLKNLTTGTWAEATFDGSAWVLTAYGAL